MGRRIYELTEKTSLTSVNADMLAIDDSTYLETKRVALPALASYFAPTSSALTISSISGTDAGSVTLTANDGEYIPDAGYIRFTGSASFGSSGGDYDIQINLSQVYLGISGQKIEVDIFDGSDNYLRTVIGTIVGETPIAFQVQTGSVQTFKLRWKGNLIKT